MAAVLEGIELGDDNTARSSCAIRRHGRLGDTNTVVLRIIRLVRLLRDFSTLGEPHKERRESEQTIVGRGTLKSHRVSGGASGSLEADAKTPLWWARAAGEDKARSMPSF